MNLTVNFLANIAPITAAVNQITTQLNTVQTKMSQAMALPSTALASLQTFRSGITSAALAIGGLSAAFTGLTAAMVMSFASQESAFAGIRKTVNATEEEFTRLHKNLTLLSNRVPVSFEDLSKIGELAGQLGIRGVDNLTKFTETIARIAVSTNLSTEAAAIGFARIAAVMQEPIQNIDKMASAVVALGNNFATTESEILTFAERIAGAGKIAGLTTAEVFGLGAAFSSVGVKAESGGTAIQKLLIAMTKAASVGGENLRILAKLAGETEEGFQSLFKAAPAQAFVKVLEGIQIAGDDAFTALNGLVGEEARFLRAMLSMSNAGDLLARVMAVAGEGFDKANAHIIESDRRFATFTSTMQILRNTIMNFAAAMGETLMPILRVIAKTVIGVVEAFQALPAPIKAILAFAIAAAAAITALTAAAAAAITMFVSLTIGLGYLGLTFAGLATGIGYVVAALVTVGLAVTAAIKLYQYWTSATKEQRDEIDRIEKNLRAQGKSTEDLGDKTKEAADKALASLSIWEQFWQGVGRALLGVKGYAKDVWATFKQLLVDTDAGLKEWAPGFYAVWQDTWAGLTGVVSTAFDSIVNAIKIGGPFLVKHLTSLVVDPIRALINRGLVEEGTDAAAAAAQREIENQLKREEQRGKSMGQMGRVRARAPFTEIDEKEFERQLKAMQGNLDRFNEAQAITAEAIKQSVAMGTMSEREGLDESIKMIGRKGQAEEEFFKKAFALAGRLNKDSRDKQADIVRDHDKARNEMALKEMEYYGQIEELERKNTESVHKAWVEQAQAAIDAYDKIGQKRLELSEDIKSIGVSETESMLQGFYKDLTKDLEVFAEAKSHLIGISRAYEEATLGEAEAQEKFNKRVRESVAGARATRNEWGGAVDSIGKVGLEAIRASEAWDTFGKSYKDLLPWQQKVTDLRAEEIMQMKILQVDVQGLGKATEHLTNARAMELAGMKFNDAYLMSVRVKGMEAEQKNLDLRISMLNTVNNHEQVMAKKRAQLLIEEGQNEADFYKFSVGALRKWAAEQDNIWQAYEKLITNTLGAVQRTMSDVFFNFFTGQTMKMKDVFKDLLNSILREIANFMAAAAVKGFIAFLGNLASGQSVGTSAQGALGSLLGTKSSGTGTSPVGTAVSGGGSLLDAAGKLFGWGSTTGGLPSVGTTVPSVSNVGFGGGMGTGTTGSTYTSSSPYTYDYGGGMGTTYTPSYTFDYGVSAYASGGRVPGYGRGDTVPAMLEPGEFVVRRSVAEQMGPTLDRLNGGGRPMLRGGRLGFAVGGTVPVIEARSVTTDQLLQAILLTMGKQVTATQTVAQNTGQTTQAVTAIAEETTGTKPPAWIGPVGSTVGTEGTNILTSGLLSGSLGSVGKGASALGFNTLGQSAVGLAGIASLVQGIQQDNTYMAARGGLTTAAALAGILSNPTIAAQLGLTPAQAQQAGLISQGLQAGVGIVGLIQGIQQNNPIQAAGGGISTAGSIANILASKQAASALGYGSSAQSAFGVAGGALGVAGGGLGIYSGIQAGDPAQIALGAFQAATGAYSIAGSLGAVTPLSTVAADVVIATAPELASSLGLVGSTGAAGGAYLGGMAAVGAGGVTAGAALTGVGVAFAAILALGQLGFFEQWASHPKTQTEISGEISGRGRFNLIQYLSGVSDLRGLVEILNTQWGPHGEVQLKSSDFFGGLGDYQTPGSTNYNAALGALYTPEIVNAGTGLPWAEAFIRGLSVSTGPTGAATQADPALAWTLQSKIAAALPNLPAYMGIKAATSPGGDLFQAEQQRLASWTAAITGGGMATTPYTTDPATGYVTMPDGRTFASLDQARRLAMAYGYVLPPKATNTYDPYTGVGYTPDGRAFLLAPSTIADYGINPYTYDPYASVYGYGGGAYTGWGAGDTAGITSDQTGSSEPGPSGAGGTGGAAGEGVGMARGGWAPGTAWAGNFGYANGGWVNGRIWGRDSVRANLSPGEFVVPSRIAAGHTNRLEQLAASGQWAGGGNGPMSISITINGDVSDPRATAKTLGAAIRDELRRIEPRYSRAGNKTQG